jgi:flagellar basal-body rod protein FlgB
VRHSDTEVRPPRPSPGPLPLFDITHVALERALSGASLRQRTLTDNLANANVPGYQRRDVDFHGALQRAMGGGTDAVERTGFAAEETGEGAVRPDGGSVDPDREATMLAQNALEYEALAAVVKGRSSILRTAIGGR